MSTMVTGTAAIPPGTYYFPPGTSNGNFTHANVDTNGLIPVYFRPKDSALSARDMEDTPEDDGGINPRLHFNSHEQWKKHCLMRNLPRGS